MQMYPFSETSTSRARAWAQIRLDAVKRNVELIHELAGPQKQIMAVVKANAYGHGLVPIAETALKAGATWLGVATVKEGEALRQAGITAPICLLSVPLPEEMKLLVALKLIPLLGQKESLEAFALVGGKEAHLEIDTGMGRAGALPAEAVELWRHAKGLGLYISGLCTHFAEAETQHSELTRRQLRLFQETRRSLEEAGARFKWFHYANSAALLMGLTADTNLVRPGLLVYGILPSSLSKEPWRSRFVPALQLEARIAAVRELPQGHPISYGATYRLHRSSRVATVLIGYGDGYPRRLSNCGYMLVRGQRAPILGRVCMDQTVIDVTEMPNIQAGERAVCIGKVGSEEVRVEEIAALIDATEHEVTTALTARIPRFYSVENSS